MPRPAPALAKLSRPRLYDAVPRERLFERLDEARRQPVTWIAGPPGAGKTTLAVSWIESRGLPCIWYQVDAGDADPSTLFYFLGLAAKRLNRGRVPMPLLTPEYLRDIPGFTRRFFRELFARFDGPGVVVLDNVQEASCAPLHRLLRDAVREVPAEVNFVCISRQQPPVELSRLAASRDLATLDWEALRLTAEETQRITAQFATGKADSASELHEHSGGWAAGLVLLLSDLRRGGTRQSLDSIGSRESIFDYFAGEVFDQASDATRDLLMRTALLREVTPAQATRITGNPEAGSVLQHLHERQYFTDRRTEPELSYRYHDLFRAFLLARGQRHFSPEAWNALHGDIARRLVERGEMEQAVGLLLETGGWDAAAQTIIRAAPELLSHGRWITVNQWIHALPPGVRDADPWLAFWLGSAQAPVDPAAACRSLALASERFAERNEMRGQLLATSRLCETIRFAMGAFAALDRWIPVFIELFDAAGHLLDEPERLRANAALLVALFWRQPGHPRFLPTLEAVVATAESSADANVRMMAACAALQPANLIGRWDLSRRLVDLGEPLVDSAAGPIPARIWFSAYVGWYLYMNCTDALAQSWLRRGTEIALSNNLRHLASLPQSFLSHAAIVTRDFPLAEQQFEQINSTLATGRVLDAAQLHLAQAMFHCGKGNAQLAMQAGRLAIESANASGSPSVITIWHAIVGGVMAEFGRFEAAEQLLASARQASEGTAVRAYDAFMLMLDAYLGLAWRGDGRERELLRESLSLARDRTTHGSYRWFLGSIGSVMFDCAIAHGIEADYAISMAKVLRLRPTATSCAAWPWPIRIHTLGRFVVEVGGEPLSFSHKTPRKPLALLKLLVASGGSEVPPQRLVDALWPDEPGDAGQDALTVAIYRLRKVLGDPEAIQVHDGRVTIDRSRCWADAWALAKLTEPGPVPPTPDDVDRVLALYRGPFLPGDETEPWALSAHERLRARTLAFLSTAGRALEAGSRLNQALACFRRGQSVDDLAEEMYVGEMRCLRALGRRAEAMAAYRRLRQLLSVTLGVQPSAKSDALFRSLAEE